MKKLTTSRRLMVRQVISAVSILILLTALVQGQNLFVADGGRGNIYEFTPSGARSTFASGLSRPFSMAFDGAGNLFVGDYSANNIYKYTPSRNAVPLPLGCQTLKVWPLTVRVICLRGILGAAKSMNLRPAELAVLLLPGCGLLLLPLMVRAICL